MRGRPKLGHIRHVVRMTAKNWDQIDTLRGDTPRGDYISSLINKPMKTHAKTLIYNDAAGLLRTKYVT